MRIIPLIVITSAVLTLTACTIDEVNYPNGYYPAPTTEYYTGVPAAYGPQPSGNVTPPPPPAPYYPPSPHSNVTPPPPPIINPTNGGSVTPPPPPPHPAFGPSNITPSHGSVTPPPPVNGGGSVTPPPPPAGTKNNLLGVKKKTDDSDK